MSSVSMFVSEANPNGSSQLILLDQTANAQVPILNVLKGSPGGATVGGLDIGGPNSWAQVSSEQFQQLLGLTSGSQSITIQYTSQGSAKNITSIDGP